MKEISKTRISIILAALMLLGSVFILNQDVSSAVEYEFDANSCTYRPADEIFITPNSAFNSGDLRFWLIMTREQTCANKNQNMYTVRAAKDFVVRSNRMIRQTGKREKIEKVEIEKGDLLLMFDDIDAAKSGKVKIVLGENYVLINIPEHLLVKDKNGDLLKSKALETSQRKSGFLVLDEGLTDLEYENAATDNIETAMTILKNGINDDGVLEFVPIFEKPDFNSKVISKMRRNSVLVTNSETKDIYNKSDAHPVQYLMVDLPEGGYGYMLLYFVGMIIHAT